MPFGPEISWPQGFRPLDPESRSVLESAFGTDAVYRQPAIDDYGYGDPGYSDPSYDGPRTPSGSSPGPATPHRGSAFPGGFAFPGGSAFPGGFAFPGGSAFPPGSRGGPAYPEQWYGRPRLDPRALEAPRQDPPRQDPPRPGPPAASVRSAGPRLQGMNYDGLRYEDPDPMGAAGSGEPGYDEPPAGESRYQELRRSAAAHPFDAGSPHRGGPQLGPGHPSGPQRTMEPQGPGHGRAPGYLQAADRAAGYGRPRGGPALQMSAGPFAGTGPRAASAPDQAGFLPAPAGQGDPAGAGGVGVLTPPDGIRAGALRDTGAFPAAASAGQLLAPPDAEPADDASVRAGATAVRPGYGLDGPEITASWPAQPSAADLESYEDFWREDDKDAEYTGLFEDPGTGSASAKRRIGRRRGRSNDHRLWLALGGVVVVAAAAIAGIIRFEFPSHGGPSHTMITPDLIGTYARTVDLEHQADVAQLRADVIKMSAGKASRVVSAVYESGNSAAGGIEQIIMFIGGHLANADPGASVAGFRQKFPGARVVSPGSLGGRAACVETGDSVALCAWFDNDSFGEIVSPTMNASALAGALQTVRPAVEAVVKK